MTCPSCLTSHHHLSNSLASGRCPAAVAVQARISPSNERFTAHHPSTHTHTHSPACTSLCHTITPYTHFTQNTHITLAVKLGHDSLTKAVIQTAHTELMTSTAVKGHQTCPGLDTPPRCPVTNTIQVGSLTFTFSISTFSSSLCLLRLSCDSNWDIRTHSSMCTMRYITP
jgi:hypothetical protein